MKLSVTCDVYHLRNTELNIVCHCDGSVLVSCASPYFPYCAIAEKSHRNGWRARLGLFYLLYTKALVTISPLSAAVPWKIVWFAIYQTLFCLFMDGCSDTYTVCVCTHAHAMSVYVSVAVGMCPCRCMV